MTNNDQLLYELYNIKSEAERMFKEVISKINTYQLKEHNVLDDYIKQMETNIEKINKILEIFNTPEIINVDQKEHIEAINESYIIVKHNHTEINNIINLLKENSGKL